MELYVSAVSIEGIPVSDVLFDDIRHATEEDPQLSTLLQYIREGWHSTRARAKQKARQFWDCRHMFICLGGGVLRGDQIVIPKSLRKQMLEKAHEGHLGVAKSKARASEHMWWPGMTRAIDVMIVRCEVCAQFKHQQRKEPLMSKLDTVEWQLEQKCK